MKRFFITLTAMLLCIGAFAQNGETLKGDVNGDGKIDVEDVTSVVDIILSGKTYGYFYFGTTEPTAGNFTSLPGAVASYTSIGEAVGATVSVDNGETLYMLCPAAWMKGKHVDVEDGEGNSYDFVEDTDAGAISGYVIYKTQAFNEATDAILRFNNSSAETYYWYVGQTDPSSMSSIEPIVTSTTEGGGWYELGTSLPTSLETRITGGISGRCWYEAIPVDANLVAGSSSDPDTSVTRGSIVTIPATNGIQYQIWINNGATSSRHSATYNQ